MSHSLRPVALFPGFIIGSILLFISGCLYPTNCYGGSKMEPSYIYEVKDFRDASTFYPQISKGNSRNISLFSVPQDSSVGTNDIGNAITLISFLKGKIRFDKYFKNAMEDIEGGGLYLPVISPDVIGFGQARTFVIFDFKKKIHREFRIVMSIGKNIEKIAIAEARQRHFIFEIEIQKRDSNNHLDYTNALQLVDLSGEKPILIQEIDAGKVTIWTTTRDRLLLYDLKTERLQVLDMALESAHHPLADLVNRNKGKMSFSRIQLHPYLPFAILYGGLQGATFASWGEGRESGPQLLASGIDQVSFSSDGNWVVLKYDRTEPAKTYLMPVSEKYPHYLGSPILLSNGSFGENNVAWTTNPISFVASRLDEIYRWELTNQAHPESDKATFHDYIVGKDLEKLTKEKRQGLGGQH
jgi:hypothetical protein